MIDTTSLYLIAGLAVLLIGISKGGVGAFNVVAMPMLAMVIDPRAAAALILPILCVFDLMALWTFRGKGNGSLARVMLLGSLLGIVMGTLTFRYLDANGIRLIIGLISLVFGGRFLYQFWFNPDRPKKILPKSIGVFCGATGGFTSFVAHAGVPPIQIYLLPMRMQKTVLHATMVTFFAVTNYVKLIPYAWLGQLSLGSVVDSAKLLPFVPIGFLLGVWLHKRLSEQIFYLVSYVALVAMGVKLTYDGLTSIL